MTEEPTIEEQHLMLRKLLITACGLLRNICEVTEIDADGTEVKINGGGSMSITQFTAACETICRGKADVASTTEGEALP